MIHLSGWHDDSGWKDLCTEGTIEECIMGLSIHSPTLRKPLDMLDSLPLPTMLTGVIVNFR